MQPVDLLIADIDWLITIDTQRRIIRDASVAVDNPGALSRGADKPLLDVLAAGRGPDDPGDVLASARFAASKRARASE